MPGDVYRDLFAVEPAVQRFTFEALSNPWPIDTVSQGLEARISALLLRRAKGQMRVAVTQEQLARHLARRARSFRGCCAGLPRKG